MVKKIDPVDWDKWEDHVAEPERPDVGPRYSGKDDGQWQEYKEPPDPLNDFARMRGHKAFSASVSVGSLVRIFRKLFDKRRAK